MLVAPVVAAGGYELEALGQVAAGSESSQRWQQVAGRQVPGSTEYDEPIDHFRTQAPLFVALGKGKPCTQNSRLVGCRDGDNGPMSSRSARARRVQPRRAATRFFALAASNVEGAVHGAVVIGLLFAAEDAREVGYPDTVGAAVIVLALFWLTGVYAHDLGDRLERRETIDLDHVRRSFVHELTIIEGGLIPVLALLIAWAVGASVTAGVTASIWATAATIIVLEVFAGWRAHLPARRLWLRICGGALMGLAIVVLKVLLH